MVGSMLLLLTPSCSWKPRRTVSRHSTHCIRSVISGGRTDSLSLSLSCRSSRPGARQVGISHFFPNPPNPNSINQLINQINPSPAGFADDAIMVYKWEKHKDILHRLYVEEKKPLDEVVEIMRRDYQFMPRYVYFPW
ncbi:hypothetical protein QBC44DRAFT_335187 [Cladorrhinum sp. PSN332]|nr:hypothetical protein QBC44DRAFT_335187 [Cladorrhinum sp. PSN332]